VESGVLRLVGNYPRYAEAPTPAIAHATGNDALGIVATTAGHVGAKGDDGALYVFPIELRTGEALPPVVISRGALSHPPRACSSDDEGWVVSHTVSRSFGRVQLVGTGRALPTGDVEARMVVREGDVCLSALAANASGGPLTGESIGVIRTGEPRPISLVINDHAADRRFGFRCGG
jgi:hypothetical protein